MAFVITGAYSTVELTRDHASELYGCTSMPSASLDWLWSKTESLGSCHLLFEQASAHRLEALPRLLRCLLSGWKLRWDFSSEGTSHHRLGMRAPASNPKLRLLVLLASATKAACCLHRCFCCRPDWGLERGIKLTNRTSFLHTGSEDRILFILIIELRYCISVF